VPRFHPKVWSQLQDADNPFIYLYLSAVANLRRVHNLFSIVPQRRQLSLQVVDEGSARGGRAAVYLDEAPIAGTLHQRVRYVI
jgi:hypothetical protein